MAKSLKEIAYESAIEGKNEEQRQIISYLFDKPKVAGGCLSASQYMSDEEFWQIVYDKRNALNLPERALDKFGLDEDELSEMPPVCLEGFRFKDAWFKKDKTGHDVSSTYQVSWLFFSPEQVCLYKCIIYLDEGRTDESTEEYYYKDVTAFITRTESESSKNKDAQGEKMSVQSTMFSLVVPGATLSVACGSSAGNYEDAIRRMKHLLKEKKNM